MAVILEKAKVRGSNKRIVPELPPVTLTARQAAAYANIGVDTIRDAIAAGSLRAIRIGSGKRQRILILRATLETWVAGLEGDEPVDFRSARQALWPSRRSR